jgi:CelD/BcsL family acetyltransferase involved in cellulose biosynthesis
VGGIRSQIEDSMPTDRESQFRYRSIAGRAVTPYTIQPIRDSRWTDFIERHPRASVFHSVAWLEALRRTYGYEPMVYTTAHPGTDLKDGLVFCRVESWLTGRRLVSLPFSDHCEPLLEDLDPQFFSAVLEEQFRKEKWRYIEIRPLRSLEASTTHTQSTYDYCFHQLDLSPDLGTLFHNFHKDSTQRKIRRAERENLTYQQGQSQALLDIFYRLFLLTRRRHQVPPQPKRWFLNLIDCFGESLKIRVAFKGRQPVASILTLCFKDTLVYKYGCSDSQFNNLGGTHLLFWRAIQEAKEQGLRTLDMGRSDRNDVGLITFKGRWGATRSTLTYSRYTAFGHSAGMYSEASSDWKLRVAKQVFAHMPTGLFSAIGNLLYKHMG